LTHTARLPHFTAMSARSVCLKLLVSWEKKRPFADELLHDALDKSPLEPRDRGFVTECFYGVLRNLSSLDFLIGKLRDGELDVETRQVLRLGLYQLFHMRVAAHAVVNETVSLSRRAGGLVNALLRRAMREKEALVEALANAPLDVQKSQPAFLLEKWTTAFGSEATAALADWNQRPAEVFVRVNTLKTSVEKLRAENPEAEPHPFHPLVLRVPKIPREWIDAGLCYAQDPSTLAACDLLAPQPGELVLDACAAPGGKTTYLASLMRNEGQIVACDLWESRVERLRQNLARMGVTNANALALDTMKEAPELPVAGFDRILIDAPCSNTGVIRRRVDVRWRLTDEDFLRMPAQQLALIRRCVALLKPGGTLVYSTCSLEPEENDGVCETALAAIPGLVLEAKRHVRPWVDGVDGAFSARFRREA
jgi:16S rRNA (cytosine967-C5)-methyltransferase